jgi:hypothetical protein
MAKLGPICTWCLLVKFLLTSWGIHAGDSCGWQCGGCEATSHQGATEHGRVFERGGSPHQREAPKPGEAQRLLPPWRPKTVGIRVCGQL